MPQVTATVALSMGVRLRPAVTAVNSTIVAWPVRMTLLSLLPLLPTLSVG
jgi:hypothetical protein